MLRPLLLVSLACMTASAVSAEPTPAPDSYREGMTAFIADMADSHGLTPDEVAAFLASASYSPAVIEAMDRPFEARPWPDYRALFVTEARIAAGVAFWRAHAALLDRAEQVHGVAPAVIVAIIGVETNYGQHLGRHRVLDALTTLGFSYPRRAGFFRGELEQLLLLSREEGLAAAELMGSYAGALGMPQFIPSSYRAYAIDFDGDGRRDLWTSPADVIGSVAHYLHRHGWQSGAPVAVPVTAPEQALPADLTVASSRPVAPNTTAGALRELGLTPRPDWEGDLAPDTPATLIQMTAGADDFWIGLTNFHAITRYNHSTLYAMAVYQLGAAIRARLDGVD